VFEGGSECDVEAAVGTVRRSAELRYACLAGSEKADILSVRELHSCNYQVVVTTPLLCQHPAFKDVQVHLLIPPPPPFPSPPPPLQVKGNETPFPAVPAPPPYALLVKLFINNNSEFENLFDCLLRSFSTLCKTPPPL